MNNNQNGVTVSVKITKEIFHSNTRIDDYFLYGTKAGSPFGPYYDGEEYLVAKHKESGLYRYFSLKNGNFHDHPFKSEEFNEHINNGSWTEVNLKVETLVKCTIVKSPIT